MPTAIKNTKNTSFTFRVDGEVIDKFKTIAKENGATASDWINKFVEQVVVAGKLPLQDMDELKTELAVEEFRNQVYEGYIAMREGRVMTLDELEKRIEQW